MPTEATATALSPAQPRAKPSYRVLYVGQCEICQACVSWLKALDHENRTVCLQTVEETEWYSNSQTERRVRPSKAKHHYFATLISIEELTWRMLPHEKVDPNLGFSGE